LFGLEVLADYDGNVVLTEGLVLQDAMIWESLLNKTLAFGTNNAELYFEENDMPVTSYSKMEWEREMYEREKW